MDRHDNAQRGQQVCQEDTEVAVSPELRQLYRREEMNQYHQKGKKGKGNADQGQKGFHPPGGDLRDCLLYFNYEFAGFHFQRVPAR